MSGKNIMLILIIILIFAGYAIASSIIRYKGIKANNEKHIKFLNDLNIGEQVILSSGIFGTLKEKNKESYLIEISEKSIIRVLPSSIIGKS